MPLLARADVPEHVRALTSQQVLDVEADLVARLARTRRAARDAAVRSARVAGAGIDLDPAPTRGRRALAGDGQLLVVEGAAGAGKTTTLRRRPRAARACRDTGWWW